LEIIVKDGDTFVDQENDKLNSTITSGNIEATPIYFIQPQQYSTVK
jgi:hypothetical protein